MDFRYARFVVEREAAVQDFGTLGEVGAIGDKQRKIVRNIDRLVDAVAELLHVGLVEVHVDRRLVDLRYAVLKSGLDAEFIEFDGQHEIRQDGLRDLNSEEPNHGAHSGSDDRG